MILPLATIGLDRDDENRSVQVALTHSPLTPSPRYFRQIHQQVKDERSFGCIARKKTHKKSTSIEIVPEVCSQCVSNTLYKRVDINRSY